MSIRLGQKLAFVSIGKRSRPAEEERSAWLQQASSCKACVAKLRPQHGSIAAALWRSARSIEFLNQAIRFANRKSANRDNGPHSRGAKRPSCWLRKALINREGAGKGAGRTHGPRAKEMRGALTTGTAETTRPSLRGGLRAYFVLPGEPAFATVARAMR